jgi:hypothetical protein
MVYEPVCYHFNVSFSLQNGSLVRVSDSNLSFFSVCATDLQLGRALLLLHARHVLLRLSCRQGWGGAGAASRSILQSRRMHEDVFGVITSHELTMIHLFFFLPFRVCSPVL